MSTKFTKVTGIAAALLRADINTDIIAPTQRPSKKGATRQFGEKGASSLAQDLFASWRYDQNDNEIPDFILNKPPFREARILLTGENFACGSSRESAVWMLYDFGIRCVIAPSFAGIFYNNCFKNGLLPIILPGSEINALAVEAQTGDRDAKFTIDLNENTVTTPGGRMLEFNVPEILRQRLLQGLDEISLTLQRQPEIDVFLNNAGEQRPWGYFQD